MGDVRRRNVSGGRDPAADRPGSQARGGFGREAGNEFGEEGFGHGQAGAGAGGIIIGAGGGAGAGGGQGLAGASSSGNLREDLQALGMASIATPPPPILSRYFDLCKTYHCMPDATVVLTLRYGVSYLQLEKTFGQADLVPLCEVLKGNPVVTSLDLRRCVVGSPGCYALKDLFLNNSTIRNVNLSYNDIGEHGAVALAEGMLCDALVSASLSGCFFFFGPRCLLRCAFRVDWFVVAWTVVHLFRVVAH